MRYLCIYVYNKYVDVRNVDYALTSSPLHPLRFTAIRSIRLDRRFCAGFPHNKRQRSSACSAFSQDRCRHRKLARHVPSLNKSGTPRIFVRPENLRRFYRRAFLKFRRMRVDTRPYRFVDTASCLRSKKGGICSRLNKLISSRVFSSRLRFSAFCAAGRYEHRCVMALIERRLSSRDASNRPRAIISLGNEKQKRRE